MKVDEIKVLLKSGDIAGAEAAAKAGLENDQDNVRLLILYGTCRQLQGDEATFRDTYATVKAALDGKDVELDAAMTEEWKKFETLHRNLDLPELLRKGDQSHGVWNVEYVVVALLIAIAVGVAVYWFGKELNQPMEVNSQAMTGKCIYAGPARENLNNEGEMSARKISRDGEKINENEGR